MNADVNSIKPDAQAMSLRLVVMDWRRAPARTKNINTGMARIKEMASQVVKLLA